MLRELVVNLIRTEEGANEVLRRAWVRLGALATATGREKVAPVAGRENRGLDDQALGGVGVGN